MVKVVSPRLLPLSHCETQCVESFFPPRSSENQTSDNLMVWCPGCGATLFDQNLWRPLFLHEKGVSVVNVLPRGTTMNFYLHIQILRSQHPRYRPFGPGRYTRNENVSPPWQGSAAHKCEYRRGGHEFWTAVLPLAPYILNLAPSHYDLLGP